MDHDSDHSFFDRERDRLAREITSGFEELLSSTNGLNRKLEEVLEMTREYETIASLWHSFYELMRSQQTPTDVSPDDHPPGGGLPGTGGHVVPIPPTGPKA